MWHPDVPLEYRDQIVCGDARDLSPQIPDNSVDMVFTDPVYENINDYIWLARVAARILKPGGSFLVWCSCKGQHEVKPAIDKWLTFVLPLTYTKVAKAFKMAGYRTFMWSTPCLWYIKPNLGTIPDHKRHGWLIDTIVDSTDTNAVVSTAAPPRNTYKWHKNPEAYAYWLLKLSKPGDVIYDPFTGSGSLPVLCKQHYRHFIASEIVPEVAAQAQQRLAETQIPNAELVLDQTDLFEAA